MGADDLAAHHDRDAVLARPLAHGRRPHEPALEALRQGGGLVLATRPAAPPIHLLDRTDVGIQGAEVRDDLAEVGRAVGVGSPGLDVPGHDAHRGQAAMVPAGVVRAWQTRPMDRFTVAGPAGTELPTDVVTYGFGIPREDTLKLLGHVEGKRVLDLGCGAGHNAIALAKAGAKVIGVDTSSEQIADARAACEREGVKVELHHAPLASWRSSGQTRSTRRSRPSAWQPSRTSTACSARWTGC